MFCCFNNQKSSVQIFFVGKSFILTEIKFTYVDRCCNEVIVDFEIVIGKTNNLAVLAMETSQFIYADSFLNQIEILPSCMFGVAHMFGCKALIVN